MRISVSLPAAPSAVLMMLRSGAVQFLSGPHQRGLRQRHGQGGAGTHSECKAALRYAHSQSPRLVLGYRRTSRSWW